MASLSLLCSNSADIILQRSSSGESDFELGGVLAHSLDDKPSVNYEALTIVFCFNVQAPYLLCSTAIFSILVDTICGRYVPFTPLNG